MKQTVFRTGNSLAVTIPSDFVNLVGVRAGQQVKSIRQPEKGRIVYVFPQTLQLPLSKEIVKTIRSKT